MIAEIICVITVFLEMGLLFSIVITMNRLCKKIQELEDKEFDQVTMCEPTHQINEIVE